MIPSNIQMLKQKLKNRQHTFGSWVSIGHPSVAEVLGKAGYEWIVIDNEHTLISPGRIQDLLGAIQLSGAAALVRVSHLHPLEIHKVLDGGADGVICPMINSAENAEVLVNSVKYPPLGKRSYGLFRAQGYGQSAIEYFQNSNEKSLVIAQVEHTEGVKEIDHILNVQGLDGIMTGLYDLSGSLGVPGQLSHPEVLKSEKVILDACKKRGLSCGAHLVHPTPEQINLRFELGYTFLALGVDFVFLMDGAKAALSYSIQKSIR
jgi:2-dehydro-3-deoxyglucarate aldolase